MSVPAEHMALGLESRRARAGGTKGAEESRRNTDGESLSLGQQAIWFTQQSAPRSAAYNLVCSLTFRGDVDVAALGRAVKRLWNRHAILRSTFVFDGTAPRQRYGAPSEFRIRLEDASGWDEATRRARWDALSDEPFDLERGPLLRATILADELSEEYVLHLAIHHIIADFWTLSLILRELPASYAAERIGTSLPPAADDDAYRQFKGWQQQLLQGDEGRRLAEYWRRQLVDAPGPLMLPTDRPYPTTANYDGAAFEYDLGPELVTRLRAVAQSEGTTLFVVCLAGFFALLHRYSGQEDLIVGSPTLGRNDARWARVLGNFTNPIALRARFAGVESFRQLVRQLRDVVRDGLMHADMPLPAVVEQSNVERVAGRAPLIQAVMAWERVQRFDGAQYHRIVDGVHTATFVELEGEVDFTIEQRGAPFELTLQICEWQGSFHVRWQYATALFDRSTIRQMAGRFDTLLASIADDPDAAPSALSLLSADERAKMLELGMGPRKAYATDVCLHELIERQAAATPEACAVRFRDQSLTYRELNDRAAALGALLRAEGVGPDVVVGVYMNRSLELVTSLLAVLKAGGAYLPLNPEDPGDRVAFQLEDAKVGVVLTRREHLSGLAAEGRRIVVVDELSLPPASGSAQCAKQTRPENLAYVIYTSGSTGKPKGVMIEHRAIVNRLLWMQDEYGLTPDDRVLQKTPFTFDVSVWEFFWPLITGVELVVAEPGGHRDPGYLARLIAERGITTCHFVPTMLRAFLDQPQLPRFRYLKRVFASGEALTPELVERFHTRCDAELHNLYGPTEAAVDVTYWHCRRDEPRSPVPIGRPIANMETCILDARGQLQPIGVPGELCLGGVGLARGYWNRPELTAERFIPHPFRRGERLYRTGDVARWTADGVIEYLGRSDDQIKLGGNRIELGEIETALAACPGVCQAAADVRQDSSGLKRLVGYVVPAGGESIDSGEIRAVLSARLPAYMVPAFIMRLDELPLSSSGKIDRRRLPAPPRVREDSRVAYVAPRNKAERELHDLFAEVLGLDRIGIHDNFFDLGGASNQAVEIIGRAAAAGYPLTPELVFRHPTIAELAEACALPQPPAGNTVVESLGVYLPPASLTSDEIMSGCVRKLAFPLARLTGIKSRPVAGETEFSFDLAVRAVEECLRHKHVDPSTVDAVICCNISRYDGPNFKFTYEPSTAVQLCARFGFDGALAFDVSNACAGMFTGVSLADGLIKGGLARRVIVVSGEYISYLTKTAQQTIESDFDSRLPCLTVGDAGAALLLGPSANDEPSDERDPVESSSCDATPLDAAPSDASVSHAFGLAEIDLCTLSEHSRLCIAKMTPDGPIMFTDMLGVSSVITQQGLEHWIRTARRKGWSLGDVRHMIPHQVSQTTIVNGFNEVRKRSDVPVSEDVVISNVAQRGNTATTSHWVAVWDHIRSGRIKSGDTVVFGVSGSGITVGTALYRFDDLPDRLRRTHALATGGANGHSAAANGCATNGHGPNGRGAGGRLDSHVGGRVEAPTTMQPPARRSRRLLDPRLRNVAFAGLGATLPAAGRSSAMDLAEHATRECLTDGGVAGRDVNLLVYTGVYRDEFLSEPAFAALLADRLRLHEPSAADHPPFFAFDVLNGSIGFLQACYVAAQRIQAGKLETAIVATAEVEVHPEHPLGLQPAGGAVLLRPATAERAGFGEFVFVNDLTRQSARTAVLALGEQSRFDAWIDVRTEPDLCSAYVDAAASALEELLRLERLRWDEIGWLLPPQISPEFTRALTARIPELRNKLVDCGVNGDLFTASLPFGLKTLRQSGRARPGDVGILLCVGAGVQAGCATYRF